MFEEILGNEPIKAYLGQALREGRLPQTLLFSGIEGVGKGLFARAVAKQLLGAERLENCPDFHLLRPEGKSGLYPIEAIRELIDGDHSAPFEGAHQVFVLEEAERMQPAAANALLKTLEEPTEATTFILISSAPGQILPTILSRCVHLLFQPIPKEKIEEILKSRGLAPHFAKWSHGSVGIALEWAQNRDLEELRTLLRTVISSPALEQSKSLQELEKKIEAIKEENPVYSYRLVESLFAQILMWARDREVKDPPSPFFPRGADLFECFSSRDRSIDRPGPSRLPTQHQALGLSRKSP